MLEPEPTSWGSSYSAKQNSKCGDLIASSFFDVHKLVVQRFKILFDIRRTPRTHCGTKQAVVATRRRAIIGLRHNGRGRILVAYRVLR
jgi:hypothetical protein